MDERGHQIVKAESGWLLIGWAPEEEVLREPIIAWEIKWMPSTSGGTGYIINAVTMIRNASGYEGYTGYRGPDGMCWDIDGAKFPSEETLLASLKEKHERFERMERELRERDKPTGPKSERLN